MGEEEVSHLFFKTSRKSEIQMRAITIKLYHSCLSWSREAMPLFFVSNFIR